MEYLIDYDWYYRYYASVISFRNLFQEQLDGIVGGLDVYLNRGDSLVLGNSCQCSIGNGYTSDTGTICKKNGIRWL